MSTRKHDEEEGKREKHAIIGRSGDFRDCISFIQDFSRPRSAPGKNKGVIE